MGAIRRPSIKNIGKSLMYLMGALLAIPVGHAAICPSMNYFNPCCRYYSGGGCAGGGGNQMCSFYYPTGTPSANGQIQQDVHSYQFAPTGTNGYRSNTQQAAPYAAENSPFAAVDNTGNSDQQWDAYFKNFYYGQQRPQPQIQIPMAPQPPVARGPNGFQHRPPQVQPQHTVLIPIPTITALILRPIPKKSKVEEHASQEQERRNVSEQPQVVEHVAEHSPEQHVQPPPEIPPTQVPDLEPEERSVVESPPHILVEAPLPPPLEPPAAELQIRPESIEADHSPAVEPPIPAAHTEPVSAVPKDEAPPTVSDTNLLLNATEIVVELPLSLSVEPHPAVNASQQPHFSPPELSAQSLSTSSLEASKSSQESLSSSIQDEQVDSMGSLIEAEQISSSENATEETSPTSTDPPLNLEIGQSEQLEVQTLTNSRPISSEKKNEDLTSPKLSGVVGSAPAYAGIGRGASSALESIVSTTAEPTNSSSDPKIALQLPKTVLEFSDNSNATSSLPLTPPIIQPAAKIQELSVEQRLREGLLIGTGNSAADIWRSGHPLLSTTEMPTVIGFSTTWLVPEYQGEVDSAQKGRKINSSSEVHTRKAEFPVGRDEASGARGKFRVNGLLYTIIPGLLWALVMRVIV